MTTGELSLSATGHPPAPPHTPRSAAGSWRRPAGIIAITLGLLTGCATAPPHPQPQLSARLEQARIDETKRVLSVAVTNRGPTVHIERLQLIAPPFPTLPPVPIATDITTTPRVDLRVPYGTARCDGRTIPEPEPAHALVWLRQGSTTTQIRLPLPHPNTLLRRLVRLDCGKAVVQNAATIHLGDRWTRVRRGDHQVLRGTIVMRRKRPGPTITLHDIRGSVILQLKPLGADGTPIAVLSPGQTRLDVPVQFAATRCDAHALAESKKTFVFPHWAAVDTLEPQYLEFHPSSALRAHLDALIADTCTG